MSPFPDRMAAELERRSSIRAARRAALIEKHDDVAAVLALTGMESSIVSAAAELTTFDEDGEVMTMHYPARAIASGIMSYWPATVRRLIAESYMWQEREDDLCAVLNIDVIRGAASPLHPTIAMRKVMIDTVVGVDGALLDDD